MEKVRDLDAVLLAIYLWIFTILKLFWYYNSRYSTIVLLLISVIIISYSLFYNRRKYNRKIFFLILLVLIVYGLLFIDILLRNNDILLLRVYEFSIYGVIPVYLFTQITNFRYFLKTYVCISLFSFFIYTTDPINNYRFTSDYMVYGFQTMFPTFVGLHLGRIEFKKNYLVIPEILVLFMIIVFGNRVSAIACVFFFIVVDLFYRKPGSRKVIKYTVLISLFFIVVLNLKKILLVLENIVSMMGIYSYSLNSIILYLNNSTSSLLSGREVIWKKAIQLISERPFFGWGTGYFESVFGSYAHNFILDIILSYGIAILLLVLFLLFNSVHRIFIVKRDEKIFGIILFCTIFPKLLTSTYIFVEPTFWIFLVYGLSINKKEKSIINEFEEKHYI